MQGYNGSQCWDTTFAVQAIMATGLAPEFTDCLRRAHHYVDVTQARTPPRLPLASPFCASNSIHRLPAPGAPLRGCHPGVHPAAPPFCITSFVPHWCPTYLNPHQLLPTCKGREWPACRRALLL